MITTTLNRIREHSPCVRGWRILLEGLSKTEADDEPLPYSDIARINGLVDALWCCRVEPQHDKVWRLYAVRCARRVQHTMNDLRSLAALDVAEQHASGQATDADLALAWTTAWAAAEEATGADFAAAWAAASVANSDATQAANKAAAWATAEAVEGAELLADFIAAVDAP